MVRLPDPLRDARQAVRDGRFAEATDLLERMPDAVHAEPEWQLLSAMAAWRLGRFAPSRRAATAAREAYRARGDADGEMRAANVAAAGAFALGDLEQAERDFDDALAIARHLGDELMTARCSNNLGNVSFYLGRTHEAQRHYRLARAGLEQTGDDSGVAAVLLNIGFVWRDVGQMDRAFTAADAALDTAERAGSPRVVAQAFSSRGEALAALGDPALGRTQVERGLFLSRRENDRLAEAEALRVLATIERERGNLGEAESLAREALEIVEAVRHAWGSAEVHRDLAAIHLATGRPRDAAAEFGAAEQAFLRLGSMTRAAAMRERADAAAATSRRPE